MGLRLRGGFRIADIELTTEPITDAIGREAAAQTTISGADFCLLIRAGQVESELSISVYHEVLEAAAVAADDCPAPLVEFNEGDFERTAQKLHRELGPVSARNLDRMLEKYGF